MVRTGQKMPLKWWSQGLISDRGVGYPLYRVRARAHA
jgi:hypothetical protein